LGEQGGKKSKTRTKKNGERENSFSKKTGSGQGGPSSHPGEHEPSTLVYQGRTKTQTKSGRKLIQKKTLLFPWTGKREKKHQRSTAVMDGPERHLYSETSEFRKCVRRKKMKGGLNQPRRITLRGGGIEKIQKKSPCTDYATGGRRPPWQRGRKKCASPRSSGPKKKWDKHERTTRLYAHINDEKSATKQESASGFLEPEQGPEPATQQRMPAHARQAGPDTVAGQQRQNYTTGQGVT